MTVTTQFRHWAEYMAARFAAPVYLVGSAVHNADPRDVDVRVVLPDAQFEARYGSVEVWQYSRPGELWVRDVAKLTADAVQRLRVNLDLQIQPASVAALHAGEPRKVLARP